MWLEFRLPLAAVAITACQPSRLPPGSKDRASGQACRRPFATASSSAYDRSPSITTSCWYIIPLITIDASEKDPPLRSPSDKCAVIISSRRHSRYELISPCAPYHRGRDMKRSSTRAAATIIKFPASGESAAELRHRFY